MPIVPVFLLLRPNPGALGKKLWTGRRTEYHLVATVDRSFACVGVSVEPFSTSPVPGLPSRH